MKVRRKTKLTVLITLIAIMMFASGVIAANIIMASEVTYQSSVSSKQNVQDALDELYEKANNSVKLGGNFSALLIYKANDLNVTTYTNGNAKEMYSFYHGSAAQVNASIDYRYIGKNPSNYVKFNNEVWRIIGVFPVDDGTGKIEYRVKIIRNDKLSNIMAWNSNDTTDWVSSTLNTYLNGTYYNSLTSTAKNQIGNAKYYLGTPPSSEISGEQLYLNERGTNVYSGNSTNVQRKIALMYASDYVYGYALGVDNTCYQNPGMSSCPDSSGKDKNWLHRDNMEKHEWLIVPYSSIYAFYITSSYYLRNYDNVSYQYEIRPVLYLKSDIKIIKGDGTIDSPYEIA